MIVPSLIYPRALWCATAQSYCTWGSVQIPYLLRSYKRYECNRDLKLSEVRCLECRRPFTTRRAIFTSSSHASTAPTRLDINSIIMLSFLGYAAAVAPFEMEKMLQGGVCLYLIYLFVSV